jgi:hypothetical protein
MKQLIGFLMVGFFLLASCEKKEAGIDTTDKALASPGQEDQSLNNGFYVSGWEQYASWNHTDSAGFQIMHTTRETPALTNEVIETGVVLTYSKISLTDPDYMMFKKPVMLPFYFLPPAERPIPNTYYWYDINTPGKIKVSYSALSKNEQLPAGAALNQFQFRYFVIAPAFLKAHGLTASQVKHHYTYQQLIGLLGVKE